MQQWEPRQFFRHTQQWKQKLLSEYIVVTRTEVIVGAHFHDNGNRYHSSLKITLYHIIAAMTLDTIDAFFIPFD
jgi:hypothetical protein